MISSQRAGYQNRLWTKWNYPINEMENQAFEESVNAEIGDAQRDVIQQGELTQSQGETIHSVHVTQSSRVSLINEQREQDVYGLQDVSSHGNGTRREGATRSSRVHPEGIGIASTSFRGNEPDESMSLSAVPGRDHESKRSSVNSGHRDSQGQFDNPGHSEGMGCCDVVLWFFSILMIVITLPFSLVFCMKVVQEYERAVIFRLGKLVSGGAKGPGLFFIVPCIDAYTKVDLRTVAFDVPPQEILTRDSVTVAVDAVVYFRIKDATASITNVEDANRSTRLLAQTTLRNTLGTKTLSEILADREAISQLMQGSLDSATDPWGVRVERVEVKDVRLPVQLQRAMAAEAEAARDAKAKVIAAEGERKASHALKEAADVMSESPAALQLRYLQTLNTISAEKNSTIIFPLPIDMLSGLITKR